MRKKGAGPGASLDHGGLRGGLRRYIWTETQRWRRSQVWEDPQEGSSGRKNSKCKGPEARYSPGLVGTRPGYKRRGRAGGGSTVGDLSVKDVGGFQDSNEEFGVLSAFDGQSLERPEQGTGIIWLTLEKVAFDCRVPCRARMEAARSVRKPIKGPE